MNRIFISLLGSVFLFASVFAEETPLRSTKAVKMQKLERSRLIENQPTLEARSASYWNKPYKHENRNGALSVLVDSSGNGYGLVSSVTSCLLYTSPSPRDATLSRMPSSA